MRRQPRTTRTDTRFPYTTPFRTRLAREGRHRCRRTDQDGDGVEEIREFAVGPRLLTHRPADLLRLELQRRRDIRQHVRAQKVAVLLVALYMARQEMHAAYEPEDLVRRLQVRAALDALSEGDRKSTRLNSSH